MTCAAEFTHGVDLGVCAWYQSRVRLRRGPRWRVGVDAVEGGSSKQNRLLGCRGLFSDRPGPCERTSRQMWLADLPEGHSIQATFASLIGLIKRIPRQFRLSVTPY